MQLLLWYADQTVISTDVDVAVRGGKCGDVRRRQAVANDRPASGLPVVQIKTTPQGSRQYIVVGDQQGIGVDFDGTRCRLERVKSSIRIETQDSSTVGSDHPLGANLGHGSDPVVFEVGSCGRVVELHVAAIQFR